MMTLATRFAADSVALDLEAKDGLDATEQVAALLSSDPRITRWPDVNAALGASATCLAEVDVDFAICIRHARTDAVSTMVMSAGRFLPGVRFPDHAPLVRYIFCIAVPVGLAADYLRIVGLLARVLRDRAIETQLREAATPSEFIAALARLEAQL